MENETNDGATRKAPPGLTSLSPWEVLTAATKSVPFVKYALGITGVAAAAAIVLGFFKSPVASLLATIVMIVLMTVLYVLARGATRKRNPAQQRASDTLMWALVLVFIVWASLLTLSVFANFPKPFGVLLRDLLGVTPTAPGERNNNPSSQEARSSENVRFNKPRITLDELPLGLTAPMAEINSGKPGSNSLSLRPQLTLDGTTLVISTVSENAPRAIYASRLELLNGGRIVTNGSSMSINAGVIATNGTDTHILSFEQIDAPSAPEQVGAAGSPGGSGGRLTLHGSLEERSTLRIDLRGQNGGAGRPGKNGTNGAAGPPGENGSDSLFDCKHGGGNGASGNPGSNGEPGGRGGNGGNGGQLVLVGAIANAANNIAFQAQGGQGGAGGTGGGGGKGGEGGRGGGGTVFCRGGQNGASGAPGNNGAAGEQGSTGQPGRIERSLS